ncbi:MAG: pyrroline-5-carboxylate reductase [Opitutales bacterium]
MKLEIAFLGAGKMVSAIVNGLINEKVFHPHEMACVSAPDGTSEKLSQATGIGRSETLEELLSGGSARLLLGCKPQQFKDLDPGLAEWAADCTILSIMAGITLETMAKRFPKARHLVRSMPNAPGQIGAGVTAYAMGEEADDECRADIERILGSLGRVFSVQESQLDAVTAMSGSGPGYVFEFACALEEAGMAIGLEQSFARTLAIETILGSGRLMARSGENPETLRNYVASPNGTTQAALEHFSEAGLRAMVNKAVIAARDRSLELSSPDA